MRKIESTTKFFDVLRVGDVVYKDQEIIENFRKITEEQLSSFGPESEEIFIRLINILLKRNLKEDALYVVESVLVKEDKNTEFLEKKALILQAMEKFDEALKVFRSLVLKDPENPHYHNLFGECHRIRGRKDLAIKQFYRAIESKRNDLVSLYEEFDARESLSFLFYESGKYTKALEQIHQVITRNSRHPLWRLLFKILEKMNDKEALDQAQSDYKRAKMAEKHFLKGEEYKERGNIHTAIKNYRMARNTYPEEPEYHFALGNLYLDGRNYEEAEIHLARALEIFPENERYLLAITGCLIGLEEYERAYDYTERGIRHSPATFIDSFEMLSLVLEKVSKYIVTLTEIISMDKKDNFPLLMLRLGKIFKTEGKEEQSREWYEMAIKVLEKTIIAFPGNWRNRSWLGDAMREVGRYKDALKHYLEARRLINEGNLPLQAIKQDQNIAETYTQIGEYDRSIEIYNSLVRSSPLEPLYPLNIGINQVNKGEYKKANRSLEKALGLDERNPETLYYLALVNSAVKNIIKSIKFLKSAITINSDYLGRARNEKILSPLFKGGLFDKIISREMIENKFKFIQNP